MQLLIKLTNKTILSLLGLLTQFNVAKISNKEKRKEILCCTLEFNNKKQWSKLWVHYWFEIKVELCISVFGLVGKVLTMNPSLVLLILLVEKLGNVQNKNFYLRLFWAPLKRGDLGVNKWISFWVLVCLVSL